jgi:hypothetical protein
MMPARGAAYGEKGQKGQKDGENKAQNGIQN